MPAISALDKVQNKNGRSYSVKVLIEDTNNKWVDISDKIKTHKDLVVGLPKIKINTDSKTLSHKFYASAGEMTVDNSTRFWDGPAPSWLKTTDGSTAVFSLTKEGSESVWVGRRIRFILYEFFGDNKHREKTLGTFLIDDVMTSLDSTAAISIVDLSEPLRKRDASVVKNGQSWYQNRSISFLVKKLVELSYGNSTNGLLPVSFDIEPRINLSTFDESFTSSSIGPPPMETDTDGDGISDIFYERNLKTRAICIAPSTISYANRSAAKDTIYLGCDRELYSYNPTTDLFTRLTATALPYYIKNIWFNEETGELVLFTDDGLYYNTTTDAAIITNSIKTYIYQTATGCTLKTTIADVYNSKFICRTAPTVEDAPSNNSVTVGLYNSVTNGPNICTPYNQYIRKTYYGSGASYYNQVEFADSETVLSEITAPGYIGSTFSSYDNDASTEFKTQVRYTIGQQGCVCFNSKPEGNYYTSGALLYSKATVEVTSEIKSSLHLLDVSSNVVTTIDSECLITYDGTDYPAIPICACADTSSTKFYIGLVAFPLSGGSAGSYYTEIWEYNYGTEAMTKVYSTWTYYIPVELYFNSSESTNKLYVVGYNGAQIITDGTSSGGLFNLRKINISAKTIASVCTATDNMNNQPTGLVVNGSYLYFVLNQTGQMWRINYSTGIHEVLDSGFPVVEDSYFLRSGLIVDTATRTDKTLLWGISGNSISDEATEEDTGKNYLFKYDSVISEFIELADFSDISVWDALGLLAQRSGCVMGFDENGNFFFKKRAIGSTASYTIDADSGEVFDIKKERGKDEIYNYVEVTPYLAQFTQPEFKYSFQPRSDAEESTLVSDEEIILKQTDTLTKKVDCICILDGNANVGAYKTGYPLFKYSVYEEVITGRFVAAHTSQTTLYIGSTFGGDETDFGIKAGYYLLYTDSNEDEYYYEITAVDNETNTITVSTAITTALNDEFKVYRRYNAYSSSKYWSDDGVTYVQTAASTSTSIVVHSVQDLSVGTVVFLQNRYTRITAIDKDTKTITVDTAVTVSANDIVRAYFAPSVYSTWYEIGGTNVHIKIGSQNNKTVFKQGDRLTIDCPGMTLDSDDSSKQVAVNIQSQAKYGKQQYPNINNRFLTRKLGKQLAQYVRSDYAFPRYDFTVTVPLSTYLDIKETANMTRIDIRSQALLPYRSGYTEPCRLTAIEHDLKSAKTTLTLKADSFY